MDYGQREEAVLVAESCHNGVTTHIVKLAERLIGVGAAVEQHIDTKGRSQMFCGHLAVSRIYLEIWAATGIIRSLLVTPDRIFVDMLDRIQFQSFY